jgi:hypothetical protein
MSSPLRTAAELVLLFHSGSPWDWDKKQQWDCKLIELLGPASSRKPAGYHHGLIPATNEATTKNLCDAVRAALASDGVESEGFIRKFNL